MNSSRAKSIRTAYLLWLASVFGWLGLHRFYLGKRRTAVLWICTFGVLGIGALADAFFLKWLVRRYNRIRKLRELRHQLMTVSKKKQVAVDTQKFEEAADLRAQEVVLLNRINKVKTLLSTPV